MSKQITIGPYTYEINEAGDTIKRYDEEYKMWITTKFGCGNNPNAADDLIKMLTKEFIKRHLE